MHKTKTYCWSSVWLAWMGIKWLNHAVFLDFPNFIRPSETSHVTGVVTLPFYRCFFHNLSLRSLFGFPVHHVVMLSHSLPLRKLSWSHKAAIFHCATLVCLNAEIMLCCCVAGRTNTRNLSNCYHFNTYWLSSNEELLYNENMEGNWSIF